ncbi:MAG: heme-binding protein [Deltaproteobacteria bacterium]|nr:heme-binding protein [Deltaproteobacteria bacterium]
MIAIKIVAAALCLSTLTATSYAQVFDKKTLSLAAAQKIAAAAEADAITKHARVVIAVVDDGGNLLVLQRLDDTQVASVEVGIGKARTAAIFRRPSREFEEQIKNGRIAALALPGATPLQGGIPITFDGKVIGAIGVSGETPAQDEEIALAGAQAAKDLIASETEAPLGKVSYFDNAQVADSFAKGGILFNGSDKYMVHTSRRDKAGVAEVHTKDADIIYVQDGSAIFVTGGMMIDPQPIAPDEIRGKEITGGETRTISKGDVIIVPAGTPHWFKHVPAPMTYYVVKAR